MKNLAYSKLFPCFHFLKGICKSISPIVFPILLLWSNSPAQSLPSKQPDSHVLPTNSQSEKINTSGSDTSFIDNTNSLPVDTGKGEPGNLTYYDIRGLERKEKKSGDGFRRVLNGVLFPIRQTFNGFFFVADKTAAYAIEKDLVSKVENMIYFYEREEIKAGWFPVVAYSSGPRFMLGWQGLLEFRFQGSTLL